MSTVEYQYLTILVLEYNFRKLDIPDNVGPRYRMMYVKCSKMSVIEAQKEFIRAKNDYIKGVPTTSDKLRSRDKNDLSRHEERVEGGVTKE